MVMEHGRHIIILNMCGKSGVDWTLERGQAIYHVTSVNQETHILSYQHKHSTASKLGQGIIVLNICRKAREIGQ